MRVCADDMIFDTCFQFEFIDTRVLVCARHLALILTLVGQFYNFSGPACLDLKLEPFWTSC